MLSTFMFAALYLTVRIRQGFFHGRKYEPWQSDLGPCCLQYRLPMREQTTKVSEYNQEIPQESPTKVVTGLGGGGGGGGWVGEGAGWRWGRKG